MTLIQILLTTISKAQIAVLVLVGIVAGLINTYLLYLINHFLTTPAIDQQYFFLFGLTVSLFILVNIFFSKSLIAVSQKTTKHLKEKLYKNILSADCNLVTTSSDDIYTIISNDISFIAESFLYLIQIIVSLATIVSCLFYLCWLSTGLFFITISILALGIAIYGLIIKRTYPQLSKSRDIQDRLIFYLNEILKGVKELTLYPKRGNVISGEINKELEEIYKANCFALTNLANTRIIGQSLLFSYLGVLLIFSPLYFFIAPDILLSYCIVLLYILRPIEVLMNLIAPASRANIAAKNTVDLISRLEAENKNTAENTITKYDALPGFESLDFQDIYYAYKKDGKKLFEIGPFDLNLQKNEVVFIYGGNGSGKTTLFNSLLGICPVQSKSILYNNTLVPTEQWDTIAKQIFAPVFSDFHLFDKFYGIKDIDREKLKYLFHLFEIDHKVTVTDNGFSTLDLSTGQRKRLALIHTLLENRPILVLDEWAADQDPFFRKKFYTEIIPDLVEKEDKTIIAITHDDQYFHLADRLYKMDYGQLSEVNKKKLERIF